jgi:prephenate dehydrogenase/chorismate mutase/prephenate dehydrogenase
MMIAIQAIRHFSTFSLGVFLAEEKIDIGRSLDFSSPPYRLELCMVSRLFAQSASLVIDIMLATEERREAIERLANTYNRLAQLVVHKDRDALIREFEAARNVFGEEISYGLKESTDVINVLSTLLAAKEVEQEHPAFPRTRSTSIPFSLISIPNRDSYSSARAHVDRIPHSGTGDVFALNENPYNSHDAQVKSEEPANL